MDNIKDYKEYRIYQTKALENINASELLFENSLFNASVNRAYYAAFQSAISILIKLGFEFENASHKTVQATFNSEIIHRKKIIPAEFSSYLSDMLQVRTIADYRQSNINKKKASKQLEMAKKFYQQIFLRG